MSQGPNPYASGGGYDPGEPPIYRDEMAEPRLSVMSVLSIVCSIPFCCIPALGIVGATLGAVSLVKINASQGRVYGRGAAVTGLLLGIITTALWTSLYFGVAQAYTFYKKQMAPAAQQFMVDASKGDIAAARTLLSPGAEADLTDDRLLAFMATIEASEGKVIGVHADLERVFESFKRLRSKPGGSLNVQDAAPVPLALETTGGTTLMWCLFDESGFRAKPQQVQVADMVVLLNDGRAVTLRESGPGADVVLWMHAKLAPVEPATPGADGAAPVPTPAPAPAKNEHSPASKPPAH